MQVQLTIRTLPELPAGAKYKCVFGEADPIEATVTATGLSCPTPDLQSRPTIPTTALANTLKDHVLVPLSVSCSNRSPAFRAFGPAGLRLQSICLVRRVFSTRRLSRRATSCRFIHFDLAASIVAPRGASLFSAPHWPCIALVVIGTLFTRRPVPTCT